MPDIQDPELTPGYTPSQPAASPSPNPPLTTTPGATPPVNTAQPNPATNNPTPYTNPAPATADPELTPGYTPPAPSAAVQGFNAAVASNTPAPQDAGTAASLTKGFTPPAPPDTSTVDNALANDKDYQKLVSDSKAASDVATQGATLLDTYKKMESDAGIPGIDTQLLNTQKIINGTEDDIRNEVKAVNGFATDSQVLALASARNKSLIQNYNNLLATKTNAEAHINTMIGLAGQDRQNAIAAANQQLQIDSQLEDYRQKFISNAQEAYKNVLNAVGYSGLVASLNGDAHSIALAEQTLGLAPGQLNQIATQEKNAINLKNIQAAGIQTPYYNAGGEIQNSQTGEAYSNPEDFQAKTGMSLEQAQAKGLISSSGTTAENAALDTEQRQLNLEKTSADIANTQANTAKTKADTNKILNDAGNGNSALLTPYLRTSWDGTQYADLSSLTPSDKPKYAQLASAQGLTPILDAGTAGKLNGISVSKENLQNIQSSLNGVLTNDKYGFQQGLTNTLKSITGNADIKSFNAWRTAVINNVQALAGGQGSGLRINQAEIDTALKNDLPVITGTSADTLDQAKAKISKLNSQLDTWTKQILGGGNTAASKTTTQADGTVWQQNSDGSYTRIK